MVRFSIVGARPRGFGDPWRWEWREWNKPVLSCQFVFPSKTEVVLSGRADPWDASCSGGARASRPAGKHRAPSPPRADRSPPTASEGSAAPALKSTGSFGTPFIAATPRANRRRGPEPCRRRISCVGSRASVPPRILARSPRLARRRHRPGPRDAAPRSLTADRRAPHPAPPPPRPRRRGPGPGGCGTP